MRKSMLIAVAAAIVSLGGITASDIKSSTASFSKPAPSINGHSKPAIHGVHGEDGGEGDDGPGDAG
jgi:hypothetical protein